MVTSHQLDPDVPVLVFKIGSLVIHHGAVGIVRSLGRLGVPMYAVIEDPYTPLAWCRYLSRSFAMNWNSGGGVLRRLLAIGESVGRHTILVPTDDQGAIFIAEHATQHQLSGLPRNPAIRAREVAQHTATLDGPHFGTNRGERSSTRGQHQLATGFELAYGA